MTDIQAQAGIHNNFIGGVCKETLVKLNAGSCKEIASKPFNKTIRNEWKNKEQKWLNAYNSLSKAEAN